MAKKIILVLIIFGLSISVLLSFLIYLQLKGIKKNSQGLISIKKELILFESKANQLEQFKKKYLSLEPNLKKIDSFFIDQEVPIELIKFWEDTASNSGLSIEISPLVIKPSASDPWKSLGFQIILKGPFPKFLRFLEKIETGSYLIDIQSLTLKKEEIAEDNITATLLIKVFTK